MAVLTGKCSPRYKASRSCVPGAANCRRRRNAGIDKRVSRLAANIPLFRYNLCPLSFVDLPERAYIDGLLGVYEQNRVALLRDVFVWAYERSTQHYAALRQAAGEPDRFHLRFRHELTEVVRAIVREQVWPTPEEMTNASAGRVPPADLDDFVRMALGNWKTCTKETTPAFAYDLQSIKVGGKPLARDTKQ